MLVYTEVETRDLQYRRRDVPKFNFTIVICNAQFILELILLVLFKEER